MMRRRVGLLFSHKEHKEHIGFALPRVALRLKNRVAVAAEPFRNRAPQNCCRAFYSCADAAFPHKAVVVQLSKIEAPKGLGRATNSVPLCAGRNMSPHVLKRGFSIPLRGKNGQTVLADIVHAPFFIGSKRILQIFSM